MLRWEEGQRMQKKTGKSRKIWEKWENVKNMDTHPRSCVRNRLCDKKRESVILGGIYNQRLLANKYIKMRVCEAKGKNPKGTGRRLKVRKGENEKTRL